MPTRRSRNLFAISIEGKAARYQLVQQEIDRSRQAQLLEERADAVAAARDIASAIALLREAVALDGGCIDRWLKLAALSRAGGDLGGALDAVSGALRIDPLAFLPLLLKANLLDRLGKADEAGQVYGYALAQVPDQIPAYLEPMVIEARRRHEAHSAETERRLAAVAGQAALSEDEERRVSRFRTNILRKTHVFHSEPTHFHYPGLREREFHDRENFPWLAGIEAAVDVITEDFHRVMAAERAELVPYIQYPDDVPLRQWVALNQNRAWTAIHLVQNGVTIETNSRHCPATMALLEQIDQPHIPGRGPNAMFSLLQPGTHIPPHTGVSNARLVCHLPLIVPSGCWFRVGAETRDWEVGKAWIFDDTIEHEAMNPTDALRVLLIVDVWHPDLSPREREAVAAIIAATDAPSGGDAL